MPEISFTQSEVDAITHVMHHVSIIDKSASPDLRQAEYANLTILHTV